MVEVEEAEAEKAAVMAEVAGEEAEKVEVLVVAMAMETVEDWVVEEAEAVATAEANLFASVDFLFSASCWFRLPLTCALTVRQLLHTSTLV